MFGSNREWTDADDARLRQMAADGVSKIRIGVCLKRSEMSIKKRAAALGVKLRRKRDGSAQNPHAPSDRSSDAPLSGRAT